MFSLSLLGIYIARMVMVGVTTRSDSIRIMLSRIAQAAIKRWGVIRSTFGSLQKQLLAKIDLKRSKKRKKTRISAGWLEEEIRTGRLQRIIEKNLEEWSWKEKMAKSTESSLNHGS